MNLLLAIAMSALISVSGWLNEGLKALEKKDYDFAIENLSKITKENSEGTRIYEVALFYRAQAYQGKKENDKALAELTALLKGGCGKELRGDAKKLYLSLGGKPEKLHPEDSPKKVWETFTGLAAKGDMKSALDLTTGQWRMMLSQVFEANPKNNMTKESIEVARSGFIQEITKGVVGDETLPEDPETGTAILAITNVDKGMNVKMGFSLDRDSNRWLISSYMPDMQRARAKVLEISNMSNLKQIGLACRMYSQDYKERFPPDFDALIKGGYLENTKIYLWTNPDDQSKEKFVYCPGLTESSSVDFMLAAAPRPANGKREVLYVDGHAASIAEEDFQKAAKTQNWNLAGLVKVDKKDIPEAKQKLIRDLVAKIADPKAEVRQDAKKKLREMGAEALPVIEEFKNSSDPEIKLEVREILKGK
jgi:hypothetical protein